MSTTRKQPSDDTASLPSWLELQAARRGGEVALRHKREGVWQARTWGEVHAEVRRLAGSLRRLGFGAQDRLVVVSHPRPEALLFSLAAQRLGGVAVLLDPHDEAAGQLRLLAELAPDFVFAEGRDQVDRVLAADLAPRLLAYADGRGVRATVKAEGRSDLPQVTPTAYRDLLGEGGEQAAESGSRGNRARADEPAFAIYRRDGEGELHVQRLRHDELLGHGRALVEQERLGAQEEAFAARAFAASAQARYLVAPWLLAGFRLNFPENLATRDNDRREIGPTLVAGTCATYRRVEQWARERLPPRSTWQRGVIDWALAPRPGPLRRVLGHWLVRRPLRDVIGFTRTRTPLIIGEPLPAESLRFFAALGVHVRVWPEAAGWQRHAVDPRQPHRGWVEFRSAPPDAFDGSGDWEPA
ncbi:AMP-binding protein [Thauera sinica]|uniref:AMP-binding protein n=1 Tax=Thauera sinica TaxID=2665146 RepID=A0ABW1APE4_9RHOO|nr:AMP-binding protein [Thauera sp. K11]